MGTANFGVFFIRMTLESNSCVSAGCFNS